MNLHRLVFCILLFTTLTGCVNLKSVNDFASNSLTGAQGFEKLPVTFTSLCQLACSEADIKAGRLKSTVCDCRVDSAADVADQKLYKTLNAYLDGLQQLSAGTATTYKVDDLSGQLSGLHIPAETAGAYTKLGAIVTKALTDSYRRNKLKAYISSANKPLQIIVNYLKLDIDSNLSINLKANQQQLESDYFDLLRHGNLNAYEKRKVIEEFYTAKAAYKSDSAALNTYGALLKTISAGHQALLDNFDKVNAANLKALLSTYTSDISTARSQLTILTKK